MEFSVGTKIVTNNPRMIEYAMDITSNYKEPEGSAAEREQHERALESIGLRPSRYRRRRRVAEEPYITKMDVKIRIDDFHDVEIGKPITGFIELTNEANSTRTILAELQVDTVCSTGTIVSNIYTAHEMLKVDPNQVRRINVEVATESYIRNLDEDFDICVFVFAKIEETGQIYRHRKILKILKPKLTIEVKPVLALNKEEQLRIQLENPFSIALTGCELKLDGTGFQFDQMPIRCNLIDAYGTMIVKTGTISKRLGFNQLIAVFSCAQVKNVRAVASLRTV